MGFGDCENFPGEGNALGKFLSPHSSIASALALSSASSLFMPVDSLITFISLQSSYAWYLNLSQFETVFLALLMLQISFFRYLEILPINLNNWFLGEPSGRKRRRRKRWLNGRNNGNRFDCENDFLMKSMLKVLRKLDDGNCLSMTLCELESMSASHYKLQNSTVALSKSIKDILAVLKASSSFRKKVSGISPNHDVEKEISSSVSSPYCPSLDGLKTYEDAVILGSLPEAIENYHNSTICEQRYSSCPLTKSDVEHYIGILIKANMLFAHYYNLEENFFLKEIYIQYTMDLTCAPSFSPIPLVDSTISVLGFPFSSDMTLKSSSSFNSITLSTILILLFGSTQDVSSVITNVSVIQSWRWFFHLSPFESIFLFFIIVEIGVLELLGLLPINLTEYWQGEPSGRRKRRRKRTPFSNNVPEKEQRVAQAEEEIGSKLLILFKKLDMNQCGFRALCELQSKVIHDKGYIPPATKFLLTTLHSYAEYEKNGDGKSKRSVDISPTVKAAIKPYAEAVKMGSLSGRGVKSLGLMNFNEVNAPTLDEYYYGNVTRAKNSRHFESLCSRKYSSCPATSDEIMEYIQRIHSHSLRH